MAILDNILGGTSGTIGGSVGGTVGGVLGGTLGGSVGGTTPTTGGLLGGTGLGGVVGTVGGVVGGVTGGLLGGTGGLGGVVGGVTGGLGGVIGGVTGGTGGLGGVIGGVTGGTGGLGGVVGGVTGAVGGILGGADGIISATHLLNGNGLGNILGGTGLGGVGDVLHSGLIPANLLAPGVLSGLGIPLPTNGLIDVGLLDSNHDGLVSISLLNHALDLNVLDPNSDGLIDIGLLDDLIHVTLPTVPGPGPHPGPIDHPTDPSQFDVVLTGTAGRDTFVVGSKATYVDGLGDIDTVTYASSASNFTYDSGTNGILITDGTKVDYLQSVERVNFVDGTLLLDTGIGENSGIGYRLYQAALDRAPDVAGLVYWINRIDAHDNLHDISAGFLSSVEFATNYGSNLTNAQFIDQLYHNILQRAGEGAGLQYWNDQLNAGHVDRATVLISFSESAENVALTGSVIADGVFIS